MKKFIFILFVFSLSRGMGQIYVDKPIILNGAVPADRQIENLLEPVILQDIATARTIQNNTGRYGIASGSDSLNVYISSGMQFYTDGNLIYFKCTLNNSGPTYLSVNNLPFFPLLINGTVSLKAGQLKAGQVYCAIFSASSFQLLSPVNNDCRQGYTNINDRFCIETNERAADNVWQAMVICNNNNARLCKWGEWYYACQKSGTGLLNMTGGNWEWTDDAADANIRIAGRFGCTSTGAGSMSTDVFPFRCCYSK